MTSPTERPRGLLVAAGLIAAASAALSGCWVCGDDFARFAFEFEDCAEPLCGLLATGSGSAERVVTIHPGEHGLRLQGPIHLGAQVSIETGRYDNDGLWLELVTTCDGPLTITYDSLDIEATRFGLVVTLPPGPQSASSSPSYRRSFTTLPPAPPREGPFSDCGPDSDCPYTLTWLTVVLPSGACTIDQLRVMEAEGCEY